MNPLEIVLIVIGLAIIIVSCMLVEKKGKTDSLTSGTKVPVNISLSEAEKGKLKESIEELLSEVRDEAVVQTDDALSKITNEKIMAVHEFSDQIIEKIHQNHEEVVFLYNMLNDKEKELKSVVREIDLSRKKVQDIMEMKADNNRGRNADSRAAVSQAAGISAQAVPAAVSENTSVPVSDHKPDQAAQSSLSSNNNSVILELYSQGRSIIEISKLLGMGQGEVKLVIDLFKGKG